MTSDRFDRDNSTLMNGQHIQNIIINSNSNSSNTTAEFHEKLNTEHHPIITTHHTTADDDDDLDYDDAHSITPMHWLVLTLACLLLFGNYYCYDIPGALNVQLRQWLGHDYDQWQLEMNSLYTAYSAPNLLMPIVGGILVDTMGPTKMLLSFSVLVVVGQSLFSLGVSLRYYWLMLLGRFLFGIGGGK
jgi:fucose permease